MTQEQLHALEEEFGLSAREILDVINHRNRCKIAVRGAIAEAHLLRQVQALKGAGAIDDLEDFDKDGYPDLRVRYAGQDFLVECKNVQKKLGPITIDFQRTRNPIDKKWERYYLPTEFQILAACLWNRTREWRFEFVATRDLPRHPTYQDRLDSHVTVPDLHSAARMRPGAASPWASSLPELLAKLVEPTSATNLS